MAINYARLYYHHQSRLITLISLNLSLSHHPSLLDIAQGKCLYSSRPNETIVLPLDKHWWDHEFLLVPSKSVHHVFLVLFGGFPRRSSVAVHLGFFFLVWYFQNFLKTMHIILISTEHPTYMGVWHKAFIIVGIRRKTVAPTHPAVPKMP